MYWWHLASLGIDSDTLDGCFVNSSWHVAALSTMHDMALSPWPAYWFDGSCGLYGFRLGKLWPTNFRVHILQSLQKMRGQFHVIIDWQCKSTSSEASRCLAHQKRMPVFSLSICPKIDSLEGVRGPPLNQTDYWAIRLCTFILNSTR